MPFGEGKEYRIILKTNIHKQLPRAADKLGSHGYMSLKGLLIHADFVKSCANKCSECAGSRRRCQASHLAIYLRGKVSDYQTTSRTQSAIQTTHRKRRVRTATLIKRSEGRQGANLD